MRSSFIALGVLSSCLTSCGGEEGTAAAAGGGPSLGGPDAVSLPYQPCAPESEVGEFVIELASEFTRVGGKVSDGIIPDQVQVLLASEGECRLLTPPTLLCEPQCAASEMCDVSNVCVPLPRNRDLGTVTVHGMVAPIEMTPNPNTRSYANPARPRLPHPGFEAGADLRLMTGGGDYAPFELRGWGISMLEVSPDPIRVQRGAPSSVRWQAPSEAGPARMHAVLSINNHGFNEASVECEFPDTGVGEIPATLIDGLIAQGFSGFPTVTLTRRTASSVDIEPGCVELLVSSVLTIDVEVEGVTSCNDASVCPAGQTCPLPERYCR